MEVYLLSIPLSRHRMIVAQQHGDISERNEVGTPHHSHDAPVPATVRGDELPIVANLQRSPH